MVISSVPHLLLVQIRNDVVFNAWEITNKDFRKYRMSLLKKYPQMNGFLAEKYFNFDKIWPDWVDLLSWGKIKNNMSLKFIATNLKTKTTVMDGTGTPEKVLNK